MFRRRRDHPRRCGENETVCRQVAARLGSPPQVRGKRGFTEVTGGDAEDHPRRCGENTAEIDTTQQERGSPPQVRGKLAARIS